MAREDHDALARRHIPDGYVFAPDDGGKVSLRRKIYTGNGLTTALKALRLPIGGYIPKSNPAIKAHQQQPLAVGRKGNVFKRNCPVFFQRFYLLTRRCIEQLNRLAKGNMSSISIPEKKYPAVRRKFVWLESPGRYNNLTARPVATSQTLTVPSLLAVRATFPEAAIEMESTEPVCPPFTDQSTPLVATSHNSRLLSL